MRTNAPVRRNPLRTLNSDAEPLGERAHVLGVHLVKGAVGDRALDLGEVLAQRVADGLAREQALDQPDEPGLAAGRRIALRRGLDRRVRRPPPRLPLRPPPTP